MIPPSLSLSLFIFLHGEEVNSSFVLACRASKAKLFQEERGCRYISRIDFPPYFCLLRISVGGRREEGEEEKEKEKRWWQRFAAGVGGGGLKKATTEAAISSGAGSPSASSRKVWRNTCTRCNEAGRLVCESNNNTSYLARTMCSAGRVCKLRRNVKQKNDKRGTRAIPLPRRKRRKGEHKGGGKFQRQHSRIFLGRSRLPMQIFVFHLSPPSPPPLLFLFASRSSAFLPLPCPSFIHLCSPVTSTQPPPARVTSVSDL